MKYVMVQILAEDEAFSNENLENGEKEIHVYSNGFRWVQVFGKDALKTEGKLMGHDAGCDYNYHRVKSGKSEMFSLRGPTNKPYITLEYDPYSKTIVQIFGKHNHLSEKYAKYLKDFLKKRYIPYRHVNEDELERNGISL